MQELTLVISVLAVIVAGETAAIINLARGIGRIEGRFNEFERRFIERLDHIEKDLEELAKALQK